METEEQQIEEIKRWWAEHGRTIIAGVILGLGTVVGWTSWRSYQEDQAEQLSARYSSIETAAAAKQYEQVRDETDELIADHPQSAYAALSALIGAHAAYNNADIVTAERLLSWAAENTAVFDVSSVARIRLARIVSEKGEYDRALSLLDPISSEDFLALRSETRGDVLIAKQDLQGAKAAYDEALQAQSLQGAARERIQLKLDEITTLGG
jgi:predicted negative regulator of RcsB-dependent stress response